MRRALGQYRLVAAVVALVTVAATLLGVCALLLGPTDDQAFARALQPSQPDDFDIDAFVVTVKSDDLVEVRETAADQLRDVLGPLDPEITVVETSPMRDLLSHGDSAVGYLAAGNGLAPRSELLSGRWPESTDDSSLGPTETTVHETAARLLGLSLGDRVRLGGNSGFQGFYDPITLVVVGTFRPLSDLGWENDLLTGDGTDPQYDDEGTEAAYGPFVVDDTAFLDNESPAARLRVTARPDMARADRESVIAAAEAYEGAGDKLVADLADRVTLTRVTSRLPDTLDRIEAQRAAGRSVVLVAVLLGAALSLAALLLAGRLVAAVRDEERVLLVSFGASARQQLVAAGCEAVLLAIVAAGVALPAAALVHSWLTHLTGPTAAGLAHAPTITGGLVLTVLCCTLALTPVLVLTAVDTRTTSAATRRRWAIARKGADWTLMAAAVVVVALSWWQLRGRPATTSDRVDVTLTLAPVICLVASTLVVVRLVPVLLHAASRLALRSPGLVLPLSLQQAARRPHPGTALVLIAAAVAAATFGLGLRSTWELSQVDQADLRVGTDLSLAMPTRPTEADAAAVLAAVDGQSTALSAVVDQPVVIGRYAGTPDAPTTLVAIDSDVAGDLLRGRFENGTWGGLAARLDPGPDVAGLALSDGAITIRGQTDGALPIRATATAVVEGTTGLRQTLTASPVPLDGQVHPLTWSDRVDDGLRLVALALHLDARPPRGADEIAAADVALTVTVPGVDGEGQVGGDWHAQPQGNPVDAPSVTVEPAADGIRLQTGAVVDTGRLHDGGGDLVVTSFAAPTGVPVALSERLANGYRREDRRQTGGQRRRHPASPGGRRGGARRAVGAGTTGGARRRRRRLARPHRRRPAGTVGGRVVGRGAHGPGRTGLGRAGLRGGGHPRPGDRRPRPRPVRDHRADGAEHAGGGRGGAAPGRGRPGHRRGPAPPGGRAGQAAGSRAAPTRRPAVAVGGARGFPGTADVPRRLRRRGRLVGARTVDGPLGPGGGARARRGGGLAVGHCRGRARRRTSRVRARDVAGRGAPGARLGPGRAAHGGLMMGVRVHRPTVRGRLRVDRGLLVLIGLVVALASALLAAVWPLTVRTADEAMAYSVRQVGPGASVVATVPQPPFDGTRRRLPDAVARLTGDVATTRDMIPDRLASVVRPHLASVISPALQVSGPGPLRFLRLVYAQAPSEPPAVTWVAGVAPQSSAGPDEDEVVLSEEDPPWPVQVGLSEDAAFAIDLEPGDRLTVEDQYGQDIRVRISGIFSPDDPDDPAWTVARELLSPAVGLSDGVSRTSVAALVSSESLPDLRIAVPSDELTEQIAFLPDPERVRWEQSSGLQQDVVELEAAPGLASGGVGWDSALDSVLDDASAQVADARGRAQVLLVGLLVTAILTLVLAALLLARRRAGPLTLARERGATLVGIGAELAVESLLVAVAGAAVGLAVTAALVGSVGWRWVLPVVAVAALAAPVLGTLEAGRATSARRVPANRAARRIAERRRRTRRLVLEAAVVGLAGVDVRRSAATRPGRGRPRSGQHAHRVGAGRRARAGPRAAAAGALGGAEGRSLGWPAAVLRGGPGCRRRAARAAAGRRGGRGGPARRSAPRWPRPSSAARSQARCSPSAVTPGSRRCPPRGSRTWQPRSAQAPGVDAAVAGRVAEMTLASSVSTGASVRLVIVDARAYERLLATSDLPDAPQLERLTAAGGEDAPVPALLLGGPPGLENGLHVRWGVDDNVALDVVGEAPRVDAATDPVVVVDAAAFAAAGARADPDTIWAVGPGAPEALRTAAEEDPADTVLTFDEALSQPPRSAVARGAGAPGRRVLAAARAPGRARRGARCRARRPCPRHRARPAPLAGPRRPRAAPGAGRRAAGARPRQRADRSRGRCRHRLGDLRLARARGGDGSERDPAPRRTPLDVAGHRRAAGSGAARWRRARAAGCGTPAWRCCCAPATPPSARPPVA